MLEIILYFSLLMLGYVYVGYPLLAWGLAKWLRQVVARSPNEPTVSILIAAYNEEESISETIQNKLELDYPRDKVEIIVISDGSTDKTDDIVRGFGQQNVTLLRQEPRAGKTSALNMAVPTAHGEVIVFSDANSIYDPEALTHLVANFSDPHVGYVSGKMVYMGTDGSMIGDGCSAYMKYENFLRRIETDLGSIVGVDGGIDAIRKELYLPMNADQLPDFVQPLKVVEQGYRVVYEPKALLREPSLKKSVDEYRMRVRVSLRSMWALYDTRQLLFPGVNLVFSWQLWSHKLLRYLCFIFLIGAFFSNLLLLAQGPFFILLFFLQCCAYLVAFIIAPRLDGSGPGSKLITFVRYFALLNLASAHAFLKFMLRQKQVIWTPRKG